MSFPNLVLTGDLTAGKAHISDIAVTYDGIYGVTKPADITRVKFDVRRETTTINVAGGVKKRYQNLPYDAIRTVFNWIGYIDVTTQSVSLHAGSSAQVTTNMNLIREALFYSNTGRIGNNNIQYCTPVQGSTGPKDPSSSFTYTTASDNGQTWTYDGTGNPYETSTVWVIRDISITDNLNGSSRVSFNFECVGQWKSIKGTINAI